MKKIILGVAFSMMVGLSAHAGNKGTGDIGSMALDSDSYGTKTTVDYFTRSNGRGWSTLTGDWDSFQLTLNPQAIKNMNEKCRAQAPKLILNFTKLNDSKMRISVDPSSVFYGKTLASRFKENAPKLAAGDSNIWDFEAVTMKKMNLLGLTMKLNTNPADEEDLGQISLSITGTSVSLSVYNGDDDGGQSFEVRGVNDSVLYDNKMPVLEVLCH